MVADYYVEYPVNTSKVKIFILTTLGIGELPPSFAPLPGRAESILTDPLPLRHPDLLRHDLGGCDRLGPPEQGGLE